MSDLTQREKAIRAAALIDTDGCISITKASYGQYQMRCTFNNTYKVLTEWLHNEYGGSVQMNNFAHLHKDGYDRMPRYTWTISSRKAERFLKEIYPFLMLKQRQARCALDFRNFRNEHGPFSREEKATKLKPYYLRMRALNSS